MAVVTNPVAAAELDIILIADGDVTGVDSHNAGYFAWDDTANKLYKVAVESGTIGSDAVFKYENHPKLELDVDSSSDITFLNGATAIIETIAKRDPYKTDATNQELFEIVRVDGERYGEIVTYGIRMVDDLSTSSGDSQKTKEFTSLTLNLSWEEGEHTFWGQLLPGANAPADELDVYTYTPQGGSEGSFALDEENGLMLELEGSVGSFSFKTGGQEISVDEAAITAIKLTPSTGTIVSESFPLTFENEAKFKENPDTNEIIIGMVDANGMSFQEGDYIATFMLTKNTQKPTTDIYLDTAQYTEKGDDPLDPPQTAIPYDGIGFNFDFSAHQVKTHLETARGYENPNVELLVTDKSTTDGLSIVPVAKNGDLIKYEVVLNVPVPTYIAGLDIAGAQSLTITGAKVFEQSFMWLTDATMATAETESLISGQSFSKSLVFDDGAATNAIAPDKATYTGNELFDLIDAGIDPRDTSHGLEVLQTADKVKIDLAGLVTPDLDSLSVSPSDAEARYVLAEFVAIDTGGSEAIKATGKSSAITFEATRGTQSLEARTIERYADGEYKIDSTAHTSDGFTKVIFDGSEVVAMGDGLYINERASNDAVGAEDALAALTIATDAKADATAANAKYNAQQLISADFDRDGEITSRDAYEILRHSVYGPEDGKPVSEWIYVDNISGVDAKVDDVAYDHVSDVFIGNKTTLDITSVLIGDVTASYTGPAPYGGMVNVDGMNLGIGFTSQVEMMMHYVEALVEENVVDKAVSYIYETNMNATGTVAKADIFSIVSDTVGIVNVTALAQGEGDKIGIGSTEATMLANAGTLLPNEMSWDVAENEPDDAAIVAELSKQIKAEFEGDKFDVASVRLFDDTGGEATTASFTVVAFDSNHDDKLTVEDDLIIKIAGDVSASEIKLTIIPDPMNFETHMAPLITEALSI